MNPVSNEPNLPVYPSPSPLPDLGAAPFSPLFGNDLAHVDNAAVPQARFPSLSAALLSTSPWQAPSLQGRPLLPAPDGTSDAAATVDVSPSTPDIGAEDAAFWLSPMALAMARGQVPARMPPPLAQDVLAALRGRQSRFVYANAERMRTAVRHAVRDSRMSPHRLGILHQVNVQQLPQFFTPTRMNAGRRRLTDAGRALLDGTWDGWHDVSAAGLCYAAVTLRALHGHVGAHERQRHSRRLATELHVHPGTLGMLVQVTGELRPFGERRLAKVGAAQGAESPDEQESTPSMRARSRRWVEVYRAVVAVETEALSRAPMGSQLAVAMTLRGERIWGAPAWCSRLRDAIRHGQREGHRSMTFLAREYRISRRLLPICLTPARTLPHWLEITPFGREVCDGSWSGWHHLTAPGLSYAASVLRDNSEHSPRAVFDALALALNVHPGTLSTLINVDGTLTAAGQHYLTTQADASEASSLATWCDDEGGAFLEEFDALRPADAGLNVPSGVASASVSSTSASLRCCRSPARL